MLNHCEGLDQARSGRPSDLRSGIPDHRSANSLMMAISSAAPRPRPQPPSAPPPPSTPASQPEPSEDRFPKPSSFSANPDTSSSTGSQPSPGAMQETHSVPSAETIPPDFWDDIWKDIPRVFRDDFSKGKIMRRISGSDAVHLAQKNPRTRTF